MTRKTDRVLDQYLGEEINMNKRVTRVDLGTENYSRYVISEILH